MSDKDYWERHAKKYDASMRVLGKPMPRMLALTRQAVSGRSETLAGLIPISFIEGV